MVSVTNFGSFPGVRARTYGTSITGVDIGEEEKLLIFGESNPANGEASVGEAVNAPTPRAINNNFGQETELANALSLARGNGANPSFLYGVGVRANWNEETFNETNSGQLSNAPLFGFESGTSGDTERISFERSDGRNVSVNLVNVDGTPGSALNIDTVNDDDVVTVNDDDVVTVNVDVVTGNWSASSPGDYVATYQYAQKNTETSKNGTLQDIPIVEDTSRFKVFDSTETFDPTDTANELDVTFKYEDDLSTLSAPDTDEIYVNPLTAEYRAGSTPTDEYKFYFVVKDFENTFDDADGTVNENETGIYAAITESQKVATNLDTKVNSLRTEYKLVQGVTLAQPNATQDSGEPEYDILSPAPEYGDAINNDAMYLFAPGREDGTADTILPAVAGNFAGTTIAEPIYGNSLSGITELVQKFSKAERDELREEHNVIPMKQLGSISIDGNTSTSTETDFARTFFVRRIVDRVILVSKVLGDAIIGSKNTEENRRILRDELRGQMEDLVDQNVIEANTENETNWYVEVTDDGFDEVGVEIGVKPVGVIKRIDEEIIIDTSA